MYKSAWGFKNEAAQPSLLWAATDERRGGVTIVVNPYGSVRELKPWGRELWSQHLLMATCIIRDTKVLLVNVYAPSTGKPRRQFFKQIAKLKLPEDVPILVGGDFNCFTDPELDRAGGGSSVEGGAKILMDWAMPKRLMIPMEWRKPGTINATTTKCFAAQTTHIGTRTNLSLHSAGLFVGTSRQPYQPGSAT